MAGLLYTYSVTSIRAAKRNARLHREADGGQLDMRRESLRRHGVLDPVQGTGGVELFRDAKAGEKQESKFLTEKQAKPLGVEQKEEAGAPRTENEEVLDTYRGRRGLKKLKDEHARE
ncbi:hypothetical protein A1O3_05993 [Capronia epimyces CBS 606.96]|uniref:Uncharacterized protein n=1 Tax=Capronia epimyces CBS 606.96 TaxID=1182542 RepID=W9XYH5_9EURO|nr:uncharacterized protein A1O3_05993 [Capronia epimyces CBS 606.96]EXJ85318.1 hypothetical protein A1O3_05993 [Capronia epimyces CBS 606.96]